MTGQQIIVLSHHYLLQLTGYQLHMKHTTTTHQPLSPLVLPGRRDCKCREGASTRHRRPCFTTVYFIFVTFQYSLLYRTDYILNNFSTVVMKWSRENWNFAFWPIFDILHPNLFNLMYNNQHSFKRMKTTLKQCCLFSITETRCKNYLLSRHSCCCFVS